MSERKDSPRTKMWPVLFRTIIEHIENAQSVRLQQILLMINESLTFDNPGLFSSHMITNPDEKLKEKAVNIWLLNQLIYSATKCDNIKILSNNIMLQKEILSACILKQSWLFRIIIDEYIKLIESLTDIQDTSMTSNNVIEIKAFHVESYPIEEIDSEAVYNKLKIISNTRKNLLLEYCIEIMKHAITLDLDSYTELYEQCLNCITTTFSRSSFTIKLHCLEFYQKLILQAFDFDKVIFTNLIQITRGCILMLENLQLWIEMNIIQQEHLISFSKYFTEFLKSSYSIKFINDEFNEIKSEILKLNMKILLNLLEIDKNPKLKRYSEYFDDTKNNIIKYLSLKNHHNNCNWILMNHNNNDDKSELKQIISYVDTIPKLIRILTHSILNEIKSIRNHHKFDLLNDENLIWNEIHKKFLDSLTSFSNNKSLTDKQISLKLKFINEILKLINKINYEFILWHQNQHVEMMESLNNNETKCELCSFSNSIRSERFIDGKFIKIIEIKYFEFKIIENILEILDQIQIQNLTDNLKLIQVEIASNILENHNFCLLLKSNQQIQLINLILRNLSSLQQQVEQQSTTSSSSSSSLSSFQERYLSLVFNINTEYLLSESRKHFQSQIEDFLMKSFLMCYDQKNSLIRKCVLQSILNLIFNQTVPVRNLEEKIIKPSIIDFQRCQILGENTKNLVCLLYGDVKVFKTHENPSYFKYKIFCTSCHNLEKGTNFEMTKNSDYSKLFNEMKGIYVENKFKKPINLNFEKNFDFVFNFLNYEELIGDLISSVPSIISHLNLIENDNVQEKWLKLFSHKNIDIRLIFSNHIQGIVRLILNIQSSTIQEEIFEKCVKSFLNVIRSALDTTNQSFQSSVINLILKFSLVENLPERTLVHMFRMTFLFLIRYESCVTHEAALCAAEICSKHNVTPNNLLNWHRRYVLKLIITLCVSIYLRNGIGLNKALSNISKMLGFAGSRYFICEHYKLIVAMLLPWCVKHPKCKELLEELSNLVQEELSTILARSFLTVYPYLFINESSEINEKCLEFIMENTGSTLFNLLHSDIKRTIPEILIHYNKSPSSVMNAFRFLLLKDKNNPSTSSSTSLSPSVNDKISEYISQRFLGVLTYFETCLIDSDFEKDLKREVLLSLGGIMRFIGTKHITPFRFKILAMLRTSLTLKDSHLFKDIYTDVWNIFINTVDIQTLGPLLSTIVASLEPLLETHSSEVNSIYKFLIITNGSLLSHHIPDLYFIENLKNVNDDVKSFIKQKTEKLLMKSNNFVDKLKFFSEQIKHENIVVRQYALKYLTQLFIDNRIPLNNLILGKNKMDPIIENILQILMISCRHTDKNLQLISGKCLGELGAIEPSHLAPNYVPQKNFSLTIHSDTFAIMALEELCKAYQFQKDTKYVDSFSLAIQEILLERGVCPKTKKKMNVWEAIPERMRQLMEPLLTSCYTGLKMNADIKVHPVFGSSKCQTFEEWAFLWASKMIKEVQENETQHLLNSFKPSIKRDTNILALFLPYIVLHAIQSSNDEFRQKIYEELQCVFEVAVNRGQPSNDETNNQPQQQQQQQEFNRTRMRGLKTINFLSSNNKLSKNESEPVELLEIKCAKIAFEQLDFLKRWLREWNQIYVGQKPGTNFLKVCDFVKLFDKKIISKANFNCGEYARALMYIESYIEDDSKSRLQENLSFLAEIYAKLMDPDSLEGAIGLKKVDLTLSEQILINNMTDRHTESIACFEKLMESNQIDSIHVRDIVQCYLHLDTPETALLVSEGLFKQLGKKYTKDLKEIQAEPLWRLGRFHDLEELLSDSSIRDNSNCWGVHCGKALISYRNDDELKFEQSIDEIRLTILKLFRTGGAELNVYHKNYQQIMKLHILSEIEKIKKLTHTLCLKTNSEQLCTKLLLEFFKDWHLRLSLLQPTPRITEPILCIRRILLKETKQLLNRQNENSSISSNLNRLIDTEIGKMWIQSTELTRKAGCYQQAQLCIMNAEEYEPENLFLEKAKLLWKKGDQTNCFKVIEQKLKDIEEISNSNESEAIENLPKSLRLLYAEAKFLQASYNAESMNISTEMNIRYFKESLQHNKKSEKCYVHLAQYLDKVYASMPDEEQDSHNGREILIEIMNYYGRSMSCGCEFIYQSMPRLLSIWLDFTAQMKRNDEQFKKLAKKMNEFVEKLSQCLPLFIFYTAFSQIISRICHPSADVYSVLKTIIVRLILKFPQQSLWMILPAFKSSYANRVKRCTEIFNDRRLIDSQVQKLISDFNSLAELLIELTNKEIPTSEKKPTVTSLVPKLPRLLADSKFSQIILPFQQLMQPTLPPIDERSNPAHSFNAFPSEYIYIKGIQEEITVMMSLQKPRKVSLIGSDGKEYTVMMKPKDDLRKDFRLMEFNAVVKQYLHQDPEARQRRLGIRTYAVLPLNEECGLIEWVQNLYAYRQILNGYYRQKQLGINVRELKASACKPHDPVEKKRDVFLKVYLPRHPPVFGEWFKHRFATPHNWYNARTSYIRTTAVMSMVGYILGLGDRHGENILFDGTNGDTVHVDFNCLFNKGETLDYPELVPFRLTHNMVHAMGPLGIEGAYRKCCEITMRVLQSQTPVLMSVLRPFVYDSVVSWSRTYKSDGNTERMDPQAIVNVKAIEERLKGYVKIKKKTSNMPLSTEGQVNHLISEATDIDNLAAMYIGWGPYL